MKYLIVAIAFVSSLFAGECEDLMSKYHTPNPSERTMHQLKRWVKRHLKNAPDKDKVLKCLINRAADNPNKSVVD